MNKRTACFRWYNMTQKVLYITSHYQLQVWNWQQLPREGWSHPTFISLQFSQDSSRFTCQIRFCDLTNLSIWKVMGMNQLGKPAELALLKALESPEWHWWHSGARHRPQSAIHCGAVPSCKEAQGAELPLAHWNLPFSSLAKHGRQEQYWNSLEQENTELCRKMGSLFFKQPL